MISEIGASKAVEWVSLALDAATMRHGAIASNIANAHSTGYTPVRVNFEEQLAGLRMSGSREIGRSVKPFLEPMEGQQVSMDIEAARLAQNTVHYQALLKGLSLSFAITSLAINEGKRS